jgi:hypothetical protein
MRNQSTEPLSERRLAALSVIAVLLLLMLQIFWFSQNRAPMLWDDSLYATGALDLYDGLDANGVPGLLERFIHSLYGARAPLICLLPVPFFLLFGRGSEWAFHAVGLLGFAVVCFAAHRLVRRLSNGFGALVAVILLSFTPLIAGLTRQFLVELPLLAAVMLWHYVLVRSEFLDGPGEELKLGVILGSGMLLKVTFPLFIMGSIIAGIGFHVVRRPIGKHALWNWKSGVVLGGSAIAFAATTVGIGGINGYLVAGSFIIVGLFARRFWSGRVPPVIARSLVILGIAYLVAGSWYSENLLSLLRNARDASFGDAARPYDKPLANYLAEISSYGFSNLQLILIAAGAAMTFLSKKQFTEPGGTDVDPGLKNAARWMQLLWLLLPLCVFLASHNRTVRFTLPCLAAVPVAGGLLGAELRRRSRTLSTVWAATCAVLGAALLVSFSFAAGPVDRLAIGPMVLWGHQLNWDQGPPDTVAWPQRNIIRIASDLLSNSKNRTVFLLFNHPQLNWLNLKLAAVRERAALDFDFSGEFTTIQPAAERAASIQLFLVKAGGQAGPEWTEQTGRALAALLKGGGLGPVKDVYDLQLPDGGDLHFYQRVENSPGQEPDALPACNTLFGERISLVGLDLRREEKSLRWRAEWQVERYLDGDYAVYLHFQDAKGRLFARDHHLLVMGKGTRGMTQGARFSEEYVIPLDAEIHDSRIIRVGVYDSATLAKFPVITSSITVLEGHDGILVNVPESSTATRAATNKNAAEITATPNPIPPGKGFGTTKIAWNTGDNSWGEVYVAVDHGSEQLFTQGPSGSSDASWIGAGATYEFRLYKKMDHRRPLATVKVVRSVK